MCYKIFLFWWNCNAVGMRKIIFTPHLWFCCFCCYVSLSGTPNMCLYLNRMPKHIIEQWTFWTSWKCSFFVVGKPFVSWKTKMNNEIVSLATRLFLRIRINCFDRMSFCFNNFFVNDWFFFFYKIDDNLYLHVLNLFH